ncbi:MAG TPA: winged helix-turn-helix domain-containing protein [Ktedonobacterales bacterium]
MTVRSSARKHGRDAALALLAALTAQLTDGTLFVDGNGSVCDMNPAAEALLGVTAADLAGTSLGNALERLAARALDPAAARTQLAPLSVLPAPDVREPVSATVLLSTPAADDKLGLLPSLRISLLPIAGDSAHPIRALVLLQSMHPMPAASTPPAAPAEVGDLLARGFITPLADIHLLATKLLTASRRLDADEHHEMAREIARESAALREAAQAIADLAQLHSRDALRLGPVELGDLLMSIMPGWKPRAPHHSFELAVPGITPAITADAARVEQALDLLLEAAVKLSPDGGPIRVSVRPRGDEVEVSVRTFGYTARPADLQRLFEPFYRLAELPEVQVRGGLGLPLARAILQAHKGRLHAESPASGQGLLLIASWPLLPITVARLDSQDTQGGDSDAHAASGESAMSGSLAGTRLIAPRAKPVVLVHDGDPRMVRYLRANLEAQHYRPVIAREIGEARQLIDLEEPDLILLDAASAGTDASSVLRQICESTGAPIIVLARRHEPDECARLLDLGAVDYIVKPFSIEELLARVRVVLRTRQASARASAQEPVFQSGELTVDFAQRIVSVSGQPVSLSKTEFKLLRVLAQHAGMVLSHEVLLERVWGAAYSQEIEFVWVYIRRLRRKIEPDPANPCYILTVPGVGYRLVRL